MKHDDIYHVSQTLKVILKVEFRRQEWWYVFNENEKIVLHPHIVFVSFSYRFSFLHENDQIKWLKVVKASGNL